MFIQIFNFLQNSCDNIFLISAVVGTTLFVLRILMTFLGGFLEIDDIELESFDFDIEDADINHHHAPSFKLFTLHSISGFFMMFGLIGLTCINQFNLSCAYSFLIAFLSGFGVMLLTALIFRGALFFESTGNVFSINQTVGLVGIVYQRIPNYGQGKIQVIVNGVTHEILAQSLDKNPIESFSIIKVVNVIDHETVEVMKVEKDTI